MIFIEKKNICLLIFSFVLSKTQSSFSFLRVSIKIFHDETFSISFKNKTAKKRIDKLIFLNSRLNNNFSQSTFFEKFDEMIALKFVLFQKNYHINALKAVVHRNMLHDHEKTKKQHFAERITTIEIWIKKRRLWKIETCMTIYETYRYDLSWTAFHIKMIQFFREWTINDSIQDHEVHRSLSTWNLTKFDADFNAETNIESIKIVFVFAFILAFKKSITSKKKFVKANSNVNDVIIIMINQSWFWILFCATSKIFSISIYIFFLNFFSNLNFWFTFFVWFFTDTFLNFDSNYFWFEFSFRSKLTIFCFFCFFFVWNVSNHSLFFWSFRISKLSRFHWISSDLNFLTTFILYATRAWQIFFQWKAIVTEFLKKAWKISQNRKKKPLHACNIDYFTELFSSINQQALHIPWYRTPRPSGLCYYNKRIMKRKYSKRHSKKVENYINNWIYENKINLTRNNHGYNHLKTIFIKLNLMMFRKFKRKKNAYYLCDKKSYFAKNCKLKNVVQRQFNVTLKKKFKIQKKKWKNINYKIIKISSIDFKNEKFYKIDKL